jgi:hypothetical protein
MDRNLCPVRAADLEISEVTDGYVVSRPDEPRIHYLNPTAALILEACDGQTAAAQLAELVAAAFGLAQPPLEDVHRCLAALEHEGLLDPLPGPASTRA